MKLKRLRRILMSDEVRNAFASNIGVVALESTVITHGLPYPDNLKTARAIEAAVRAQGAIPATIAVMDGIIRVGLDDDSLSRLARMKKPLKLSRKDLPIALATKESGGTTVATTMMIAQAAGIRVFSTGGIGGVHRGVVETFDVSADLEELARTSVCVVCAGPKAVLDLPKTREVLETKGVPVIGYQCDDMPAFYYRNSDQKVDVRVDTPKDIAKILAHKWNLTQWPDGLVFDGGVLLVNPVPKESEFKKEAVEKVITKACANLKKDKIHGAEVTPYLLKKVSELSDSQSQKANIALLKNNAKLAARIAQKLVNKIQN